MNQDQDALQQQPHRANQVNQQAQQQQQHQAPVIVKKSLSKWASLGLNLSEAGFSKLHANESKFSNDKTKYDLLPEKFETYKNDIIAKINRMHAVEIFTVVDIAENEYRYLPKEYTRISNEDVENVRELRWPEFDPTFTTQDEADAFTDRQIKASCIGNYINESLTEAARKQLKAQEDFFLVKDVDGNEYFDGPAYFHVLSDVVDPDNAHMIENVRKRLRQLSAKDCGYSVIKMLAEFKLLKQRIDELGGTYDEDDQFLDFWDSLKTMKEKEFTRYVRSEKDSYRKKSRANRGNIDTYIRDFTKKELDMKEDNEWNVMSQEDAMIMALVNTLEKDKGFKKNDKKNQRTTDKSKKDPKSDGDKDKFSKREKFVTPAWKLVEPKEDEPKQKTVDKKKYHWCSKCNQGNGKWVLHAPSDQNSSWKPPTRTSDSDNKKVSFASEAKSSDGPSVQVNKSLLKNAKAYLAQFPDFQNGGTQD